MGRHYKYYPRRYNLSKVKNVSSNVNDSLTTTTNNNSGNHMISYSVLLANNIFIQSILNNISKLDYTQLRYSLLDIIYADYSDSHYDVLFNVLFNGLGILNDFIDGVGHLYIVISIINTDAYVNACYMALSNNIINVNKVSYFLIVLY